MKRALIVVAAAALSLSACETATPYQPDHRSEGHLLGRL